MKARSLLLLILFSLLCYGMLATRVWIGGNHAQRQAELAAERGNSSEAITWWSRTARWYLPFTSRTDTALAELKKIATEATEKKQDLLALSAWWGIRAAGRATRSNANEPVFWEADNNISILLANWDKRVRVGNSQDIAFYRGKLLEEQVAAPRWAWISLLGLFLWGASVLFWISRSTPIQCRTRQLFCLAVIVAGIGIWGFGLFLA